MKKFYTLLATAFCAYTASAGIAEKSSISNLRSEAQEMAPSKMELSQSVSTRADEDWQSIGTGTYREFIFSYLFGVDVQDLEVEIEQNTANPIEYRMVNPYENWEIPFTNVEYDTSGTYYLYFNVEEYNGKKVWYFTENRPNLGVILPVINSQGYQGMTSLMNYGYMIHGQTQSGTEVTLDKFVSWFGESSLGVFTEPGIMTYPYELIDHGEDEDGNEVLTPYSNLMLHLSNMPENSGYPLNKKNTLQIGMPGVELKEIDYFEGYNLLGEVAMENNMFTNLFGEKDANPQGTVKLYEDPDHKGYFHVQNAFVAGDWNTEDQAKEVDLAIDLTDPNFGVIEICESQFVDNEAVGQIAVLSASAVFTLYVSKEEQMTKAEFLSSDETEGMNVYIDADTKRIMMPCQSIWYYFPEAPKTSEYYNSLFPVEGDRASWIQLPADYVLPSGVKGIVADDVNAPVKYYNLQGMEVANPEAGQLVIMKKGSKASKFIAK